MRLRKDMEKKMTFHENKLKNLIYRLQNPQYLLRGKRSTRITVVLFLASIVSLLLGLYFAFTIVIATIVSFLFMCKYVNFYFRYHARIEITEETVVCFFECGLGRKKITELKTMPISEIEGIEYFIETKEIAFLVPVVYKNGYEDYGFCMENVFDGDVVSYLSEHVQKVQYVQEGSFSSKYRAAE